MPSSVFSLSHFGRFKPVLPPALIGAVALVLGLELTVRYAPDTWLVTPISYQGYRVYLEQKIFKRFEQSPPSVVIMGTSRPQFGFIPRMLDDKLGLPPNSCVNASLPASYPSDWLDVYKSNRALLGHAKCVVLCADEWGFSSGRGHNECFQLKASLAQRLALVQPVEMVTPPGETPKEKAARERAHLDSLETLRNQLVMDWAFKIRLKLKLLIPAILRSVKGKKDLPPPDESNMMLLTTNNGFVKKENGLPPEKKVVYTKRVNEFYLNFDSHPVLTGEFETLIQMIQQDGAKVLVLHLPNRSEYQAVVNEMRPLEFAQHLRVAEQLAKRNGAKFIACQTPQVLGAEDNDYRDYGHVEMKGARAFTEWLANTLRSEKLLEK